MKIVLYVSILLCTTLLLACQDDTEGIATNQPTIVLKTPGLKTRGVPQERLISLAATVEADQVTGTIHYAVFKEAVHTGKPTPQELMDSPYRDEISMNGEMEQGFTVPASPGTKYFVYALVQMDDKVSEVAELQVETI